MMNTKKMLVHTSPMTKMKCEHAHAKCNEPDFQFNSNCCSNEPLRTYECELELGNPSSRKLDDPSSRESDVNDS